MIFYIVKLTTTFISYREDNKFEAREESDFKEIYDFKKIFFYFSYFIKINFILKKSQ